MKTSIIAMSVAALLAFGVANAATTTAAPAKAKTAQQQKMSDCAKANKGKKGDDYKNSLSACLKGKTAPAIAAAPAVVPAPAATAKTTQQDKMKSCNAEAGKEKLSGNARKSFMSTCLKKAA